MCFSTTGCKFSFLNWPILAKWLCNHHLSELLFDTTFLIWPWQSNVLLRKLEFSSQGPGVLMSLGRKRDWLFESAKASYISAWRAAEGSCVLMSLGRKRDCLWGWGPYPQKQKSCSQLRSSTFQKPCFSHTPATEHLTRAPFLICKDEILSKHFKSDRRCEWLNFIMSVFKTGDLVYYLVTWFKKTAQHLQNYPKNAHSIVASNWVVVFLYFNLLCLNCHLDKINQPVREVMWNAANANNRNKNFCGALATCFVDPWESLRGEQTLWDERTFRIPFG